MNIRKYENSKILKSWPIKIKGSSMGFDLIQVNEIKFIINDQ